MNHAMEALDREGIQKAALVVFEKNEPGNGFWGKNGIYDQGRILYTEIKIFMSWSGLIHNGKSEKLRYNFGKNFGRTSV